MKTNVFHVTQFVNYLNKTLLIKLQINYCFIRGA